VDEKHLREYPVPNVCGVIITSNHFLDGLFLPPDDRRHYVAWSERTKDDFEADYWTSLWRWYEDGGIANVAAFLLEYDLTGFDAKAPPPKTAAFFDIVMANEPGESTDLRDALDAVDNPAAVILDDLKAQAQSEAFHRWIQDPRTARQMPHRMSEVGYVPVRNDAAKDGKWRCGDSRRVIYAQQDLTPRDRLAAAQARARRGIVRGIVRSVSIGPREPGWRG
ncbi:MAG TPA: hypothetical protein VNB06_21075, partial [Thermoanaerobaculia bacterium]|nr:hypothetical protein [Thermoanaerobaculia bacterium]